MREAAKARHGATLIELMVVVIIVGVLAAVAIPIFTDYLRESKISESVTNIQGILEAEQAYYTRFQRYTPNLGYCPEDLPTEKWTTQVFPNPEGLAAACEDPDGWEALGWSPNTAVYFHYRVFSHNSGRLVCDAALTQCPSGRCCLTCADPTIPTPDADCVEVGLGVPPEDSGIGTVEAGLAGVDWTEEGFVAGAVQPWCIVEAEADMDLDGDSVFVRGNSYNQKTYRTPNADVDGTETW